MRSATVIQVVFSGASIMASTVVTKSPQLRELGGAAFLLERFAEKRIRFAVRKRGTLKPGDDST
jgi:hypothetical protein